MLIHVNTFLQNLQKWTTKEIFLIWERQLLGKKRNLRGKSSVQKWEDHKEIAIKMFLPVLPADRMYQ